MARRSCIQKAEARGTSLSVLLTTWWASLTTRTARTLKAVGSEEEGQGTTEYAILVGVLVVIAIVAIIAFRDKISSLWNDIATQINSL